MSLFNPERAGLRSGAFHQKLHQVGIEPHCFAFIVFSFLCYSYVKWYQFSVYVQFSSVQFSCSVMSDSLWPHGLQHTRLPCPSPTSELAQIHIHRADDAIQPSHPLLSPSPPAFNLSQHQGLFHESVLRIRWPKYCHLCWWLCTFLWR